MPDRTRFPSLIGWRLLALLYDFFPALALWFLIAAGFTAAQGDSVRGGALGLLELAAFWLATGAYATWSWRRGGQTLGMRPWRLQLTTEDGKPPGLRALWLRYAIGTLSLLAGGLGFWWAWLDRSGLAWHDRISATRLQRRAKPSGTS